MPEITHRRIREIAALQKSSVRRENQQFLIEGSLCVAEALKGDFPLESVLMTHEFAESASGKEILSHCQKNHLFVELLPHSTLQRISSQEHSQGVLAVGIIPQETNKSGFQSQSSLDEDILLVIPRLSDPGNLGTIIRTADVFNVRSIWIGEGSVDPWHPKVVRGSMGSLFHCNIRRSSSLSDWIGAIKASSDWRILALDSNSQTPLERTHRARKTAVILGHEAEGISEDLLKLCDERVVLGQPGAGVGSLNVAVAAGILLYFLRFSAIAK